MEKATDMRRRINAYIAYIDGIINNDIALTSAYDMNGQHIQIAKKDFMPTRADYERIIERHLNQIAFFQHERLVHLIVTVLFAILTFASFFLVVFLPSLMAYALTILLIILLVPYIMHYFLLENGVQKMYRQYDELIKKLM